MERFFTRIWSSLSDAGAPSCRSVACVTKAYTMCSIHPGARPTSRVMPDTRSAAASRSPNCVDSESPSCTAEYSTDELSMTMLPSLGGHSPCSGLSTPTRFRAKSSVAKSIAA